jgi:hypothetical protein
MEKSAMAELTDGEILHGLKAEDWPRSRQVAMEVHVESDSMH